MMLNIFSCVYWPFVSSFEKCLFTPIAHLKNLVIVDVPEAVVYVLWILNHY